MSKIPIILFAVIVRVSNSFGDEKVNSFSTTVAEIALRVFFNKKLLMVAPLCSYIETVVGSNDDEVSKSTGSSTKNLTLVLDVDVI